MTKKSTNLIRHKTQPPCLRSPYYGRMQEYSTTSSEHNRVNEQKEHSYVQPCIFSSCPEIWFGFLIQINNSHSAQSNNTPCLSLRGVRLAMPE